MKGCSRCGLALAVAVAGIVYLKAGRRRVLNWGARKDEAARGMPGDEILPDAALQTTRACTIEASPRFVWPWLAQMGPRPRAGVYTYDWIERLLGIDVKNTDRILPEHQRIDAGDFFALGKGGNGLVVREVQPERFLVLQWVPARSTWTFGLYPDGDGVTRLVSRNRLPGSGPLFWLGMVAFMEPGSLIMERRMLLGIKRRAEALAKAGVHRSAQQRTEASGRWREPAAGPGVPTRARRWYGRGALRSGESGDKPPHSKGSATEARGDGHANLRQNPAAARNPLSHRIGVPG